jgi:hypothetical protein
MPNFPEDQWAVAALPLYPDIPQMTRDRRERYHSAGVPEAIRRRLHGFGRWSRPRTIFDRADLVLFLVIQTHSSRDDAFDPFIPYAGASLGRSPSISRKISTKVTAGD